MNYWFQSSDFSSKDLSISSSKELLDKIKNFDYTDEQQKLNKLIRNKEDYCPCGFGVTTDKNIIHLTYEFDDQNVSYHLFESYEVTKIYFIFK